MGAIYRITHKASGTTYVGSAMNVRKRWSRHRRDLYHGRHCNPHLQAAFDKYGKDAFEWDILEEVKEIGALAGREQFWLNEYKEHGVVYNFGECAANNRHGVKCTLEVRRRISEILTGREVSEETRSRLSKANAGDYPAFIHRGTGEIIPAGKNLSHLCRKRGLNRPNMSAVKTGRRKSCKGWALNK